jgi:hypothetical protein
MSEDWTTHRFLTFALGLSTLETLSPATIQELGEGLAWMMQEQAALATRYQGIITSQTETITKQALTIELQTGTIERLSDALQTLRAGAWHLGDEEDAP